MTEEITKQIVIDKNALEILRATKKKMEAEGIKGNSYSDAIRWLDSKVKK